jgi:hypothetical protein
MYGKQVEKLLFVLKHAKWPPAEKKAQTKLKKKAKV